MKTAPHFHAEAARRAGLARLARLTGRASLVAFALVVTAAAAALTWALSLPLADTPLSPDLVAVHESRADAALAGPRPRAQAAWRESQAGLALAPATASAWLRLAWLRHGQVGRLDPVALGYLGRSYDAAPIGPDVSAWRIRYLLENWPDLPAGLRQRALNELITTSRFRGPRARKLVEDIQNPAGRLAAQLATLAARAYDPPVAPPLVVTAPVAAPAPAVEAPPSAPQLRELGADSAAVAGP